MVGKAASGDVTGAALKTIIAVFSTADRRPKIRKITIGCSGTPAEQAAKFALRRITATGSGTAVTTFAADPSENAPVCEVRANYTFEPTYSTGNMAEFPLHQKATGVWEYDGDARPSTHLSPNTVKGLGIQMIAGPAVAYNVSIEWDE